MDQVLQYMSLWEQFPLQSKRVKMAFLLSRKDPAFVLRQVDGKSGSAEACNHTSEVLPTAVWIVDGLDREKQESRKAISKGAQKW